MECDAIGRSNFQPVVCASGLAASTLSRHPSSSDKLQIDTPMPRPRDTHVGMQTHSSGGQIWGMKAAQTHLAENSGVHGLWNVI